VAAVAAAVVVVVVQFLFIYVQTEELTRQLQNMREYIERHKDN
jgi:cell division protein FtsL